MHHPPCNVALNSSAERHAGQGIVADLVACSGLSTMGGATWVEQRFVVLERV